MNDVKHWMEKYQTNESKFFEILKEQFQLPYRLIYENESGDTGDVYDYYLIDESGKMVTNINFQYCPFKNKRPSYDQWYRNSDLKRIWWRGYSIVARAQADHKCKIWLKTNFDYSSGFAFYMPAVRNYRTEKGRTLYTYAENVKNDCDAPSYYNDKFLEVKHAVADWLEIYRPDIFVRWDNNQLKPIGSWIMSHANNS